MDKKPKNTNKSTNMKSTAKKTATKKGKEKPNMMNKRIKIFIRFVLILLLLLVIRIAWLQFVQGSDLKEKAYKQSTTNKMISPNRGNILDANGKSLAVSVQVDTITINPTSIAIKNKDTETNKIETAKLKEKVAKALSDIFELDYNDVFQKVSSTDNVKTIASKVEKDKVENLKTWMTENKVSTGINIDVDTKRYYPYNNLASSLIGFCNVDNDGIEGIELKWDNILKGIPGKITAAKARNQEIIPDKNEKYIEPENGSDIVLTIDSNIQSIAEKYLKQAVDENNCKRGGNVVIMDPSNGDILAMATYPDYNLNDRFAMPTNYTQNTWEALSSTEKTAALQTIYRNRAVQDGYEPGSTFKLLTSAIALEEDLVQTDTPGNFSCNGSQVVADRTIACTSTHGHGSQSLRQAMQNSCNPAFIQLGQKIGTAKFYKYLDAFGLFSKTNIALPGESTSSFWKEKDVGPVQLATMSFGQRFTITPLQLATAVSAIVNDGTLIQPRIVKQIKNSDTNTITNIDPVTIRQVISKETSEQMRDMMGSVVADGGGRYAKVTGYDIGGKTGTSEPNPAHPEEGYVASFIAIAPVENTKLVVLLTLYGPQTKNYYGGQIAAPVVSQILSESLSYLGIPSNETNVTNTTNLKSVPDVTNKTASEAKSILGELGISYSTEGNNDSIIGEQVPKPGTRLPSGGTVKLYEQGKTERQTTTVPDLKGKTLGEATNMLKNKKLNISSTGSGIIITQNPAADTVVEEGTVINVTLEQKTSTGQN